MNTSEIISSESQVDTPVSAPDSIVPGAIWYDLRSDGTIIKIESVQGETVETMHKWGDKWSYYGTTSVSKLLGKDYVFLGLTEEEAEVAINEFKRKLEDGSFNNEIASLSGKENEESLSLVRQQDRLLLMEQKVNRMAAKASAIQAQMKVAMTVKKREMDVMLRGANSEIQKMYKLVDKISKIIRTIELYSGINEDLVTVKEGDKAPNETPFIIRQSVIFMDEEVGQWRDGGFDYSNVEDFDKWLCDPKNLNRVCPEPKSMVVFRPRRHEKEYDQTFFGDFRNVWNKQTYFLIRNGDNLYRIFTQNLQLDEKVFQSISDIEKLEKDLQDSSRYTKEEAEKVKDLFTRQAMFIQGLIDRTGILQPVPEGVNIFQPDTYQGWLRLVYDFDGLLPDGRLSWKEWKQSVNAELHEGSRVIVANQWLSSDVKGLGMDADIRVMNDRTMRYYNNTWNVPSPPYEGGLFVVEKGFGNWDFSFKYSPGGNYYDWNGSKERKNRVSFGFDTDDNILCYDSVSLEDAEFYLNDRANRRHYLSMLPVLEKLRSERLQEIEQEKDFVKLIAGRNKVEENRVWNLVQWWKTKNKWKRPIRKDDELALRMIENKLQSKSK